MRVFKAHVCCTLWCMQLPAVWTICCARCVAGDSPNWLLTRLEVMDVAEARTFTFPCNAWLGIDKVIKGMQAAVWLWSETCLWLTES